LNGSLEIGWLVRQVEHELNVRRARQWERVAEARRVMRAAGEAGRAPRRFPRPSPWAWVGVLVYG